MNNQTPYIPEFINKWELPDCYVGASWPDYYVSLGQHRDSDCVVRSNFQCALKKLGGGSETVIVVRENHWAVGWMEWIAIHESDTKALILADEMAAALSDYPILDDDHLSELEEEEANEIWETCYDVQDRIEYIREHRNQFEFSSFPDMLGCARGKYFVGYARELIY